MEIQKTRIWMHRDEVIDAVEITEGKRRRYYSYTYRTLGKNGWENQVRWDNFEGQPHVDKYDSNGALIEQKTVQEKSLEEVSKIVAIFRRNLVAMELGEL